ncbi:MAG TPA: hypothetical protein GXX26_13035 [Clostridiaceae bacterium]|nr:hypothetical protein [Clostridiaceae bacterium]
MDKNYEPIFPEKFNIISIHGGFRVTFFCSGCERSVTKETCGMNNVEQALEEAWQEARKYFNRCHDCGAWVCDEHYNENVMKCIFCQPK